MDFTFTPEQETFRHELRSWLASHVPPDSERLRHLQPQASPADLRFLKDWQKTVYKGGWGRHLLAQGVWRQRCFAG